MSVLFQLLQAVLFAVMILILVPLVFLRLAAPTLAMQVTNVADSELLLAKAVYLPFIITVTWYATTHRVIGANVHHSVLFVLSSIAAFRLRHESSAPRELALWSIVAAVNLLIIIIYRLVKSTTALHWLSSLLILVAAIGIDPTDQKYLSIDFVVQLSSALLCTLAVFLGTADDRLTASFAIAVLKFSNLYPRITAWRHDTGVQIECAAFAAAIALFVVLCWSPQSAQPKQATSPFKSTVPSPVSVPPIAIPTVSPASSSTSGESETTPPTTPSSPSSVQSSVPPLTPNRATAIAFRPRIITPVRPSASPSSSQNLFRALVTPVCARCAWSTPTRSFIERDDGKFLCAQCADQGQPQ